MHETSIVQRLIAMVSGEADRAGGGRVSVVRVEVGALSGVEPMLVQLAYEQLVPGSRLAGSRLEIELIPLRARCDLCGVFEVPQFRFACPKCGNLRTVVVSGEEFRVVSFDQVTDRVATSGETQT
ncbi:MAG TPA: hydrogenase nickel incorporation protein HypA [Planctomycetaceae bacterium]|jgi:hydrogenase nickel incorporation protein HypA/HybF|nr:hydrogenase nickel incorporation protein HypA [Planctomycetaceae bacterium]